MNKLRAAVLGLVLSSFAFAQGPGNNPAQPATKESLALPTVAPLVDSVKAAVVNIDVQARGGPEEEAAQDLFEHFFGGPRQYQPREELRQGAGSGFVIDPKGIILTNNHVVEGAVTIRVKFNDGRAYDATVLGRDPLVDVAVIKLKNPQGDLPFVKLGDSDAVSVGDWVLAIGNPYGLASSVSLGILSAKARDIHAGPYDDFLQTDAAINPGNSGGPLFNMKGEVIGINTAIVREASGLAFAVPINIAKAVLPQLEKSGTVSRAWLGIGIQDLTPELAKAMQVPVNDGAIVSAVNEGSPAQKGGLKQDDVVTAVDGQKITSGGNLSRTVALKKPGSVATLSVYRNGKPSEVKITLGTRPDLERYSERQPKVQENAEKKGARIGLAISDMDPRYAQAMGLPNTGALVTDVTPGSAAERAELAPGVVVIEANHKPIRNRMDLWNLLQGAKSGDTVLLRVINGRGGKFLRALVVP